MTAGAILGYQHVRRQEMVEDLKSSIPELGQGHRADQVRALAVDHEIYIKWKGKLMGEVKLTDLGIASPKEKGEILSKDDQKALELATRAQRGDYDDGRSGRVNTLLRVANPYQNS